MALIPHLQGGIKSGIPQDLNTSLVHCVDGGVNEAGERIIEKEVKEEVKIGMHFVEELVFVVGLLIGLFPLDVIK